MFTALSQVTQSSIPAAEVTDETGFICPHCLDRVYLRKGSFTPHFVHYEARGCKEPVMSPWHEAAIALVTKHLLPAWHVERRPNGVNGADYLSSDIGDFHFIQNPLTPPERSLFEDVFRDDGIAQHVFAVLYTDDLDPSRNMPTPTRFASSIQRGDVVYWTDGRAMVGGPVAHVSMESRRVGRVHPILGVPYVTGSGNNPSLLRIDPDHLVTYGDFNAAFA